MNNCCLPVQVIKDLLMPSAEQLQIREDLEGVFLSNVHEVEVRPSLLHMSYMLSCLAGTGPLV